MAILAIVIIASSLIGIIVFFRIEYKRDQERDMEEAEDQEKLK